jgi:CheY-like chemotaxis protein
LPLTIVMLTSAGHAGDAERCRELGIQSYLCKPVRKQELLSAILRALGHPQTASPSLAAMPGGRLAQAKGLHILLAEDNRTNQTVATRMLQKMGHSSAVANNGNEALLLLKRDRFDVVLMDIQMPEMDGLSTTLKIRESERETRMHLPIIAMTAHAMKGDRERCVEAGMDGYVSKPISSQELEEALAAVLLVRGETKSATHIEPNYEPDHEPNHEPNQEDAVPPTAPDGIVWNMGETLERLGGDEKLLHEVLEIFLDDVPKHMANLRRAIAEGNAADVEGAAHTLKGELGYLGISEVSRKAREMEEFGRKSDLRLAESLYATFESELSEVLISMRRMLGAKADMEMVAGWPGAIE